MLSNSCRDMQKLINLNEKQQVGDGGGGEGGKEGERGGGREGRENIPAYKET